MVSTRPATKLRLYQTFTDQKIFGSTPFLLFSNAPPIPARLSMNAQPWLTQHNQLESHYPNFLGQWKSLQATCRVFKRGIQGKHHAQLLFDG